MAGQAIDSVEAQKAPGESSPGSAGLDQRRQRSLSAFICYARESDTEFRNRLGEALRTRGIEPKGDWLLTPGPSYRDQLTTLIRDSDVFIAVISRLSIASPEVRSEIEQANLQKKRLLPVQIQDGFDKAALHEALRLPQWTLLRPIDNFEVGVKSLEEAINTDFDLLVVHTWLTQRANDWDAKRRPGSALLSGRDLKEAEIWLPKASANQLKLPNVTPLQADFVLASQRARTRRAQWLVGITAVIVLVLSMLTVYAFQQRRIARKNEPQARIAESRRLAAESSSALTKYPQLSLLLAVEAVRTREQKGEPRVPAAEQVLRQALATIGGRGLGRHPGDGQVVEADCPTAPLGGLGYRSGNPAYIAAITPASRFLLMVGKYESDRLVAISPKSRWILTTGDNSTARLWDLTAKDPGAAPITLHDDERILSATFSPDGRWLITGGWSWQVEHENEAPDRAFYNPYRCHLEEGQRTVRLWDLTAKDPASSRVILSGHEKHIDTLALSPNGRWLVTGSWDETVRIWDLAAKDPASSPTVLRGHKGEVYAVAITSDGRRLITGSADRTARIWDLTAPDPTASSIVLPGHESEVSLLAVTPDGRWVITAGWGTTPRLWDLAAKAPSASAIILKKIEKTLDWVRLSPEGRWLIAGGRSAYASLTDLKAPDPVSSYMILPSYGGAVRKVAFSPDSHWLLTTTGYTDEVLADRIDPEHVARLWDLTAKDPSASPRELKGHEGVIFDAEFAPDSRVFATGSADGTVRISIADAEDPSASAIVLRGHEDVVYRVAFSPDGRWLITADLDGSARLWDLTTSFSSASPVRLSTGKVSSVATSEDGHWLFSSDRLWDLTAVDSVITPAILQVLTVEPANRATFSPDGRWLVTEVPTRSGDALLIWDLRAGEPGWESINLAGKDANIGNWAFSPNGRWLVVQTWPEPPTDNIRLWDLSSLGPNVSPIVLSGHTGNLNSFDISKDGHWLATGGENKVARLWDLTSKDPSATPLVLNDEDEVGSVSFSTDNRWLITGKWRDPGGQKTVRLWDLTARNPAASHVVRDHGNEIWELKFSPDGRWLTTGAFGDSIRFWDLTSKAPKLDPSMILPVQGSGIDMTIVFSPDGHWAVISSNQKSIQLWDLTRKPPSAITLLGHSNPLIRAVISPDSHWLITTDTQTCRIWDLTASDECHADWISITPNGRWLVTAGSPTGVRLWHLGIPTLLDLAQRTAGRAFTTEERKEYLPMRASP
jgi:WD40 repeat protein